MTPTGASSTTRVAVAARAAPRDWFEMTISPFQKDARCDRSQFLKQANPCVLGSQHGERCSGSRTGLDHPAASNRTPSGPSPFDFSSKRACPSCCHHRHPNLAPTVVLLPVFADGTDPGSVLVRAYFSGLRKIQTMWVTFANTYRVCTLKADRRQQRSDLDDRVTHKRQDHTGKGWHRRYLRCGGRGQGGGRTHRCISEQIAKRRTVHLLT